jgi:hypothetical protein
MFSAEIRTVWKENETPYPVAGGGWGRHISRHKRPTHPKMKGKPLKIVNCGFSYSQPHILWDFI